MKKVFLNFQFLTLCLIFSRQITGYEFELKPEKEIWSVENSELFLNCEVDESWQWCYWQITRSSDGEIFKYKTYQDNFAKSESDYNDDGIKFVLSDYGCGIHIQNLNFDLHDGDWKCHIADTDKDDDKLKVEYTSNVNVARESSKLCDL